MVRSALKEINAIAIHNTLVVIPWKKYLLSLKTYQIGDPLLLLMGKQLEREEAYKLALKYYQLAKKHPARERQIRILNRLGEVEKAKSLAIDVMKEQWNASEYLFAKDFLSKKNIRIKRSTSKKLKEATCIEVPFVANQSIEDAALQFYKNLGFNYYCLGHSFYFSTGLKEEIDAKHKRIGLLKTRFGGDQYPEHFFRIQRKNKNAFEE